MRLTELFDKTQWRSNWLQAGNHVSWDFEWHDSTLLLFFQPSCEKIDWARNFFFKKVPYKHMNEKFKVHAGFLKAWKEVSSEIRKLVHDSKVKRIVISGYSHGAALAGLCFETCAYERPDLKASDNIVGYGFECPRFLAEKHPSKELLDRWDGFYDIYIPGDIVHSLPLKLFRYANVGKSVRLTKHFKYGPFASHSQAVVYWGLRFCDIEVRL